MNENSGPHTNKYAEPGLLTYREAAQLLGFNRATLYSLVRQQRIPHVRLGRRFVMFSRTALEKWIADSTVPARAVR